MQVFKNQKDEKVTPNNIFCIIVLVITAIYKLQKGAR